MKWFMRSIGHFIRRVEDFTRPVEDIIRRFGDFIRPVGDFMRSVGHFTRRSRDSTGQVGSVTDTLKTLEAFARVAFASSSGFMPRAVATAWHVAATKAGSQRFPRCGTGAM